MLSELTTDPISMLDKTLKWFAMDTKEIIHSRPVVTRENINYEDSSKALVECYPDMNNNEFMMYRMTI